jgi:hypothetical protein
LETNENNTASENIDVATAVEFIVANTYIKNEGVYQINLNLHLKKLKRRTN